MKTYLCESGVAEIGDDSPLLDCGHEPSPHGACDTGYGIDAEGKTRCYACCAEGDKKWMRENGKAILYLTTENPDTPNRGEVSNWPGSLRIKCFIRRGRHNIARWRYDCWFKFEGQDWRGVSYGDNTQVCHCRRIKSKG